MGAEKVLFNTLNTLRGSPTVILTIGNSLKGDDGAGPAVYQNLAQTTINARLIDAGTVPENYIGPIVKAALPNLVIVDAVDFGGSSGQIKLFSTEQLASVALSTHVLSPNLFIDMIRAQLDVDVFFVGIQPAQTNLGQSLSPAVSEAVKQLCDMLAEIFGVECSQ